MINFKCSKCNDWVSVPDSLAGTQEACPSCGTRCVVPSVAPAHLESPAAAITKPSGGVSNSMNVTCPHCGKRPKVEEEGFGKVVQCPFCQETFHVPLPAGAKSIGQQGTPEGVVEQTRPLRKCEWCAESIPQEALRCPKCSKWRRDIVKDQAHVRWGSALAYCGIGGAGLIFGTQWRWGPCGIHGAMFGSNPWHDVVQRIDSGIYVWQFSLYKFFTSVQGWGLLFCVAACIAGLIRVCIGSLNLKRKTGTQAF